MSRVFNFSVQVFTSIKALHFHNVVYHKYFRHCANLYLLWRIVHDEIFLKSIHQEI